MKRILILLFLTSCLGYSQENDSSENKTNEILDGIILKSNKIEKITDSTSTFFSKEIAVQRFKLNSEINVQVECNMVEGKFEKARANYLIEIGIDKDGLIKKKFADSIYKYWIEKSESYISGYEYLPATNHIFYKKGDYVMYIDPQNNNVGKYYLIYFKNRILKVTFNGFDQNGGWGGLSAFLSELVEFKFDKRTIKPEYKSKFDPKKYIELYENKEFE